MTTPSNSRPRSRAPGRVTPTERFVPVGPSLVGRIASGLAAVLFAPVWGILWLTTRANSGWDNQSFIGTDDHIGDLLGVGGPTDAIASDHIDLLSQMDALHGLYPESDGSTPSS